MWATLFGSSPIPTILGYLVGGLMAVQEVVKSQGVPTDTAGWLQVVMAVGIGLLGRSAKQTNVSNAPDPKAATVVSAKSEAKVNPAAVK